MIKRNNTLMLFLAYSLIIIVPIIISIAFCLSIDLPKNSPFIEEKNVLTIFIHNMLIGLLLITLTDITAIPIIIINSFYLGIIIGSIMKSTNLEHLLFSTIHIPFELIGWILILHFSRKFRFILFRLIKKERTNFKELVTKVLVYLFPIYLIAAVIESLEIYLSLKGWCL
ncbi:stage II sporulation protein M [Staphylococcus gallinarum]|uniref:stage II sporulation protein M n=1 Tax=Staphylococcus gallinarum TaxID=1293 RepID=UPI001E5F0663|nr:stage II sporulation protein M [Staphylococcus gallinarum]MCD8917242.1 stage II sporulation protein M [Staphylococcus gallinarum]